MVYKLARALQLIGLALLPIAMAGNLAEKLSELMDRPVVFAGDCVGEPAECTVAALLQGHVAVLENLRAAGALDAELEVI